MIRLSPRLQMTAEMVRAGAVCADIGTDHARLCVYLLQNGVCPRAVAADLRPMPLKNAEKTVRLFGLEDRVVLRLSDGLDAIASDEADDVVLAGMGGTLIVELLERTAWIGEKRVIVQPMTHSEDVRRFFVTHGFRILEERACFDEKRVYVAFCAERAEELPRYSAAYAYTGTLIADNSDAARAYVKKQKALVESKRDGLAATGVETAQTRALDRVLREWGTIYADGTGLL